MFGLKVIFDIVSSDLCLILSKLRAVQSASQSQSDKNLPNVQNEGGRESKVFLNFKKIQDWYIVAFLIYFPLQLTEKIPETIF